MRAGRGLLALLMVLAVGVVLAPPASAHEGWPGGKTTYRTADVKNRPGAISALPFKVADVEVMLHAVWDGNGDVYGRDKSITVHETAIGRTLGVHAEVHSGFRIVGTGPGLTVYEGVVEVYGCGAYVNPICPPTLDSLVTVRASITSPSHIWLPSGPGKDHPNSAEFDRKVTCRNTQCRVNLNLQDFEAS